VAVAAKQTGDSLRQQMLHGWTTLRFSATNHSLSPSHFWILTTLSCHLLKSRTSPY